MNEDLKKSFQQIVADFGPDIINDKNLANIVADYYSFDRNPAVRNMLKTVVSEGYAVKVSKLKSSKGNPCVDLERYAGEIEQSWGYGKEQVRYVLSCIASSIGIEYKTDESSNKNKQPIIRPRKKRIIKKQTNNNPNIPVQNQHHPTKLDSLFPWTSKIRYWHIFIVCLLFSVTSGVVIGEDIDNRLLTYGFLVLIVILFSGVGYFIDRFCKHLNEKILMPILYISLLLGLLGGIIGSCNFREYREERKEMDIDAMIMNGDTLELSNYLKSSEYSALQFWDKDKIKDKYDSLKYVLMGCKRIVDDMNAHTRVLKSYGFSDAGIKEMYTEDFYRIISALLDYKPSPTQSTRDYMINKLIAYINYGAGTYCYPWKSKSYSDWKRFNFVDSYTVFVECQGHNGGLNYDGIEDFQVRLTKEKDVWVIDDYITADGISLKEIYTQYIKGQ